MGKSGSSNWDIVRKQKFGDTAATRDVHSQQVLERGDKGKVTNPWPSRILALVAAVLIAAIGYAGGFVFMILTQVGAGLTTGESWMDMNIDPSIVTRDWRVLAFTGVVFVLSWLIMHERLMATWRSENSMADTTDINPHKNDQYVTLIEELQRDLDWFPDAGAHANMAMTSMLSHVMLSNKGIKPIEVAKRYTKDGEDTQGNRVFKGQEVRDEDGNIVMVKKAFIDEAFGQDLMTTSGLPLSAKNFRVPYDVRKVPYNPPAEGEEKKKKPQRVSRDKLAYDTVAELINNDWEYPAYEVQRPAGAYLVDTAPANTMV